MPSRFEYFVILAEMRTGSNFLEQCLDEYPGITTYGELFNPVFIGTHTDFELLGMSLADRDADPVSMIELVKKDADGLAGFRVFHNHHPAAITQCLDDPACAKIVLTRNPLDSYISEKIAARTDQWRLTDMKNAVTAQIEFEAEEFNTLLDTRLAFQKETQQRLQVSGQTAYYLDYEDISDPDIMNGLVRYLGVDGARKAVSRKTRKQNPQHLTEKVTNFEEMEQALAKIDFFALSEVPNFEPRRGAGVPVFVAAAKAPILFMPIAGGPSEALKSWMAALDQVTLDEIQTGFTQKSLRTWMKANTPHRKVTVLRHPVRRLHEAYQRHIVSDGPERFAEMVETLRTRHGMPIPCVSDPDYNPAAHKEGFLAFIRFVKAGLGGQTALRVDPSWASQAEILSGMAGVALPDLMFREDELHRDLPLLAASLGYAAPEWRDVPEYGPVRLEDIYDEEIEKAVRSACQRDYVAFGFGPLG